MRVIYQAGGEHNRRPWETPEVLKQQAAWWATYRAQEAQQLAARQIQLPPPHYTPPSGGPVLAPWLRQTPPPFQGSISFRTPLSEAQDAYYRELKESKAREDACYGIIGGTIGFIVAAPFVILTIVLVLVAFGCIFASLGL
jgi:hypothetical protein